MALTTQPVWHEIEQAPEPEPVPRQRTLSQALRLSGHGVVLALALALWLVSLQHVNPERMGDYGLITLLPATFYAALGVLTVSFGLCVVSGRPNRALLLGHVALLIVFIHATPPILYSTVRYAWTYKHVGIVDYILRHGTVDPTIGYLGVYHDWPGFFAVAAFLTQVTGFSSALSLAGWAPVFVDLVTVSGLLLLYSSFTSDRRQQWAAVWVFSLGNWVGQDYFSPQALCYVLYLVVLGICLRWFRAPPSHPRIATLSAMKHPVAAVRTYLGSILASRTDSGPTTFSRRDGGLMIVLILSLVVIVSSHQLTPFMTISGLTALVLVGVVRTRWLPVLMVAMTVSWILYPAAPFLHSNTRMIVASLGQLVGNIDAGLSPLAHVPPSQVFVARVARFMTGFLLVLPAVGLIRRLRRGYRDIACILITVSPIVWIAATRYGHEILFRVFLFALPGAAFLSAMALFPRPDIGRSWRGALLLVVSSLLLLSGLCITYYGQEKMNYFAPDEVAAVRYFDRTAPAGSLLIEGSSNSPIPFELYERFTYLAITDQTDKQRLSVTRHPVRVLRRWMRGYPAAYVLITRAQKAEARIMGDLPSGALDRLQRKLSRSTHFTIVYRSPNAVLFAPMTGENHGST